MQQNKQKKQVKVRVFAYILTWYFFFLYTFKVKALYNHSTMVKTKQLMLIQH